MNYTSFFQRAYKSPGAGSLKPVVWKYLLIVGDNLVYRKPEANAAIR